MNNILLVTVTKIETQAVIDLFLEKTGKERKAQKIGNNIYFPLGQIGGVEVNLVQSEMGAIGPGASILTISEAIKHFSPIGVIMVGIAFGVNSQKQSLGEILVSRQIFSYEPQKIKMGKTIYRGDTVTVPSSILKIFRSGEVLVWKGAKVNFGTMLSGEKLINDLEFREKLLKQNPDAIGGEMEGAGLYSAANDAKVDWIIVKGICDFADGNKQDDPQPLAAENASRFVLNVIECGFFSDFSSNDFQDNNLSAMKIPDGLYKIAEDQIEKKKNDVITNLRPDFDFGEVKDRKQVGPSTHGTFGIAQYYQHGVITFHVNGDHAYETYATYGGIFYRFISLGENPWKEIGLPISDEHEAAWSPYLNNNGECVKGRYSSFEDGEIVWHGPGIYQDQAFVILDPIRKLYDSSGGSGSYLGFPVNSTHNFSGFERCDFEGGSIILNKKKGQPSIIRNLLRIDYSDSPFNHGWVRYSGPEDYDFFKTCLDTRPGYQKNMLRMNIPWPNRGVFYPKAEFTDVTEQFCGITVKALEPNKWIRVYIRIKTSADRIQYIELDTNILHSGLVEDKSENVDYWQIPLPNECKNSEWHTLVIDLKKMVEEIFGTKYINLERLYFRGHIGISNLLTSNSRNAIESVAIAPIFIE